MTYYQRNKDKLKELRKIRYRDNKEKELLSSKLYREKNRIKINEQQRMRYKNDVKYNEYKKQQSKKTYFMKKSNLSSQQS